MTDITPELELQYAENRNMHIPRMIGSYHVEKKILESNKSVVLEVKVQESGEKYALKCIPINDYNENLHEIYERIDCPEIIKFLKIEHFPETNPRFETILMPLASCDILNYINTKHDHPYDHTDDHMKESTVREIMLTVLKAVDYLHKNGICHSDIKPEHILMMIITSENPTVYLTGLDHAILHQTPEISGPPRGTPMYAAPELLKSKELAFKQNATYTNKIDSWSLGILLYMLLSGEYPFISSSDYDLHKLLKGVINLESAIFNEVSVNAKDLIRHLICVNPKERYSVEKALEHPWFREHK